MKPGAKPTTALGAAMIYASSGIVSGEDGSFWRAYGPSICEKTARELFQSRFHGVPAEVKRLADGSLLAGPLHIEAQHDATTTGATFVTG